MPLIPKIYYIKNLIDKKYNYFDYFKDAYILRKLYDVEKDTKSYKFNNNHLILLNRFYNICLYNLDANLGYLFKKLKEEKKYDNSLIIITSDHGECFGEKGRIGHPSDFLDNSLIKIPLLIKYPNQSRNNYVSDVVSLIDLFPTIFNYTNIKSPFTFMGNNLYERENIAFSFGKLRNCPVISCVKNIYKIIQNNC